MSAGGSGDNGDRKTPIPGRIMRDPNGDDRELLEFVLDPDHPDIPLLIRVAQKTYTLSVDAINEVRDMRALVVDVSGTQKIIAERLGIDLDKEKLRTGNEARSVPPLKKMADEVEGFRKELPSFRETDERLTAALADAGLKIAAAQKDAADARAEAAAAKVEAATARADAAGAKTESAETKGDLDTTKKLVKARILDAIPPVLKYLGAISVALAILAAIGQQAWVTCSTGRGSALPPAPTAAPAESAKPR